jgi:dephospho-CoA kinase
LLKIGLTGGIGSGKTTAGDYFAEFGAEVIDTDLLSRELVEPGQPALAEIVAAFGPEVLDGAGRLDRARLRERIFSDAGARRRLEQILHPRIRTAMLARAERTTAPYVIFVIPLLFETGQQDLVDRVLLIDVPEAMQRRRVAARDALDDAQIEQIMQAQTDRPTRLRNADDVIHNDGSRDRLRAAVQSLHQQYLQQRPL